jgi:hypothetical protein
MPVYPGAQQRPHIVPNIVGVVDARPEANVGFERIAELATAFFSLQTDGHSNVPAH